MGRVRKFLVLSANKQLLLIVAGILFMVFSVMLRVGSLRTSKAFARWLAEMGLSQWSVESVDWALSVLESNSPVSGGCLPAAMVGLTTTDKSLELRIGVREREHSIEAHAWLQCADGRLVYAGADPTEFQELKGG